TPWSFRDCQTTGERGNPPKPHRQSNRPPMSEPGHKKPPGYSSWQNSRHQSTRESTHCTGNHGAPKLATYGDNLRSNRHQKGCRRTTGPKRTCYTSSTLKGPPNTCSYIQMGRSSGVEPGLESSDYTPDGRCSGRRRALARGQ